jgi:hypothetical protein
MVGMLEKCFHAAKSSGGNRRCLGLLNERFRITRCDCRSAVLVMLMNLQKGSDSKHFYSTREETLMSSSLRKFILVMAQMKGFG